MNDEDRVRLATPSGGRMLGPVERERCSKHPRRWVLYRWVWYPGGGPEDGIPETVRGCGSCNEEDVTYDLVDGRPVARKRGENR